MDAEKNFERAIVFVLDHEGGRNFNVVAGSPVMKQSAKTDKGGPTVYGITMSTLRTAYAAGVVSHRDICKLTQAEAKDIYRKNYWDRYGWGEIEWPACLCCFDCSVNHGKFAAILQRAATECGHKTIIDGKFGPKTFAALKACNPKTLASAIYKQRKKYYEALAADPSQTRFLRGWLRRAEDMARTAGVL